MATELSYGFLLPVTGDKGSVWFPALETNIQKLALHNHDGTTAAKINTTDITAAKQTILAAWSDPVNGVYSQILDVPNNASYADVFIMIKNTAGEQLFLDVKPVSGQPKKFKVFSNDNTLTATAYILV